MKAVTLRPVTAENVRAVCKLKVKPEQEHLVASNGQSLAEAHFHEHAWHRAIYADDKPVGFVMVSLDPNEKPDEKVRDLERETPTYWKPWLWRFMIDGEHQREGYGRAALEQVIDYVSRLPHGNTFYTCYLQSDHCAEEFYLKLGFVKTGEMHDGETIMKLDLKPPRQTDEGSPVLIENPVEEEMRTVGDHLDSFNAAQLQREDDFQPVNLVFRDAKGEVIAGLRAMTGWDWLYVQTLWVQEDQRGNGLGTQLLQRAEETASERNCIGSCLSTFSFQAPVFYETLGYQRCGKIENYPQQHTMYFLTKTF